MQFQLISDIHGEQFGFPWILPDNGIDESNINLLLAGDIGVAKKMTTIKFFLEDMSERFKNVFYVMGNHEHYNSPFNDTANIIQSAIDELGVSNIYFSTNFSVNLQDYQIIGATLWTDFNGNNPLDKMVAENGMNDYHKIKYRISSQMQHPKFRKLSADDTLVQHYKDRDFIFKEIDIAKKANKKIVVMTHHTPSSLSIHPNFQGSALNPAFYTELTNDISMLDYEMVWCHGHVHNSFDYQIGKCRVLCNPHGYGNENPAFNQFLTF